MKITVAKLGELFATDTTGPVARSRLAETRSAMPLVTALNLIFTLTTCSLTQGCAPRDMLLALLIGGVSSSLFLIAGGALIDRHGENPKAIALALRLSPFVALSLCITWIWADAYLPQVCGTSSNLALDLMTITLITCGMLCTIRIPYVAMQFVLMPIATFGARSIVSAPENWSVALFLGAVALGFLAYFTLRMNFGYAATVLQQENLKRDAEIITMLREEESRIVAAKDAAESAYDSKSQMIAVMGHELRTPINAIVGFSEILASKGASIQAEKQTEYLGMIRENARHLQGLINDVIEATRVERGNITLDEQPIDAAELVEVTVKMLRTQLNTAALSINASVIDGVEITGDVTRLKQVLLNLLTNAVKFSPQSSIIHTDMLRLADGGLVITVRDTGIGISKEDVERVFEPFVQADNSSSRRFGGMGLGLSIARRIMELHGGDLKLDSELGVGTEARLILPAQRVRWPKRKAA